MLQLQRQPQFPGHHLDKKFVGTNDNGGKIIKWTKMLLFILYVLTSMQIIYYIKFISVSLIIKKNYADNSTLMIRYRHFVLLIE